MGDAILPYLCGVPGIIYGGCLDADFAMMRRPARFSLLKYIDSRMI